MTVAPLSQPFDLSISLRGGCFFGIILLAIAITAGLAGFWHFQGRFQLPAEYSTLPFKELCAGIALFFFVVGISELIRYRGYRIDPLKQTIQGITRGVFGTRYDEEIPFSELNYVQVVRENRGTHDSSKHFYFSVYISLKNGNPQRVFLSDRYPAARVCGERLAKLANVDLHDDSETGASRIRKPEELDQTVWEKLCKYSSRRLPPSIPQTMHTKSQLSFESLTIVSPRFDINSLGPMKKALWVLFAIFGIWITVAVFYQSYLSAFFAVCVFAVMFSAMLRSETIILTRDTLTVQAAIGFLKRTQQIPLSELEEMCLSNVTKLEGEDSKKLYAEEQISKGLHTALEAIVALGSSIVFRSDRKAIHFGRILSHAELDHVLFQIERWIR